MGDVYIQGADMIPFGRYNDRSYFQLGAQAVLGALDDAGLSIRDIGAVYASSCFNAQSMLGQKILKEIGQTGVPCINVSNACASGATAVREVRTRSRGAAVGASASARCGEHGARGCGACSPA